MQQTFSGSHVTVTPDGGQATAGASQYYDGSVRSKARTSRTSTSPERISAPAPFLGTLNARESLLEHLLSRFNTCKPSPNQTSLNPTQMRATRYINSREEWETYETVLLEAAELGHMVMDTESQVKFPAPKGLSKAEAKKYNKEPLETVWLTIGTFTGLVFHFNLRKWKQLAWANGTPKDAPIKDCLPEKLVGLFEKDVVWHGSGVYKDVLELGVDLGQRYVDSGWLLDTLISRGTLCHYDEANPKTGMLHLQMSMWGRERITKCFFNLEDFEKKVGKGWYPEGWPDEATKEKSAATSSEDQKEKPKKKVLPSYRKSWTIYDYNKRVDGKLSVPQLLYHTMDVLTPLAAGLLKVRTTVEANPEFQEGYLNKGLLDVCLDEDTARMPQLYKTGGFIEPDLTINYGGRFEKRFPHLPGQEQSTPRYGRYLGPDKTEMLGNPDMPKFDCEARSIMDGRQEPDRPNAAQKRGAIAITNRAAKRFNPKYYDSDEDEEAQARRDAMEAELDRYVQLVLQPVADSDDNLLDRWDYNVPDCQPPLGAEAPDDAEEAPPAAAAVLGANVPLYEPWLEYTFPPELQNATKSEKWAYITKIRQQYRPNVPKGRIYSLKLICTTVAPAFNKKCMNCGDDYHSPLTKMHCDLEKVFCVYPGCKSREQDIRHNIRVCMTLQAGCKDCNLRGHHRTECPGKEPEQKLESFRLFEKWADQGTNTKKRKDYYGTGKDKSLRKGNPYYGPIFLNFKCFERAEKCPWTYEEIIKYINENSIEDFMEKEVMDYVRKHGGGPNKGGQQLARRGRK